MLYKYLNPNLVAVGTEVTPDTKPGISIYLMDAVTGTVCTQMNALQVSLRVSYGDIEAILTSKFVDEILLRDHSNETSLAVLSHGAIYI